MLTSSVKLECTMEIAAQQQAASVWHSHGFAGAQGLASPFESYIFSPFPLITSGEEPSPKMSHDDVHHYINGGAALAVRTLLCYFCQIPIRGNMAVRNWPGSSSVCKVSEHRWHFFFLIGTVHVFLTWAPVQAQLTYTECCHD